MPSRRTPAIILAVSLAAVALVGCQKGATTGNAGPTGNAVPTATDPTTAAAAGPIEVCKLMTAAQASTIVGVSYTAANASSANTCNYPSTDAAVPLSIYIMASNGDADWTAELATIQEGTGNAPTTFSGVGDQAAGGGGQFGVRSGHWIIDILGGDPAGNGSAFPKSIALAQALIPQLP